MQVNSGRTWNEHSSMFDSFYSSASRIALFIKKYVK